MDRLETQADKPKAIDVFSGCGGLTLGLKDAGFNVVGAVEIDPFASEVYLDNHAEVRLWNCDVRSLATSEMMSQLGFQKGQLDLLAGCPPCQGFSTLRTNNGSLSGRDKRNTLLLEFLRLVEELRPKSIMLENVPGLETYRLFKPFCKRLADLGYKGNFRSLDAADYSVPQRRRRLIYLANVSRYVPFAVSHFRRITVRDTIEGLPRPGMSGDPVHDLPENRSAHVRELISLVPKDGGSRSLLSQKYQLRCHESCNGFKDVYGRMSWDKVSPTITSGCFNPSKGRFLHPEQDRAITMREASLLQGFPSTYRFSTRKGKVALALMIGNALPPPFIRANALTILDVISR